jgi:hypothetical protein
MMNRRKEAKLVFETVIKDWGGPFAITAKAFLDEMKDPSQDPPRIRRPADPGPVKKEEPKKTPAPKAPPTEAEPPAPAR